MTETLIGLRESECGSQRLSRKRWGLLVVVVVMLLLLRAPALTSAVVQAACRVVGLRRLSGRLGPGNLRAGRTLIRRVPWGWYRSGDIVQRVKGGHGGKAPYRVLYNGMRNNGKAGVLH